MIVHHHMSVAGPTHQVDVNLGIDIRFDEDGKFASVVLDPDDLGLFDHVAASVQHERLPQTELHR